LRRSKLVTYYHSFIIITNNFKNLVENNIKNSQVGSIPSHLKFDNSKLEATVLDYCDRDDVGIQLDELLVIEHYSRR